MNYFIGKVRKSSHKTKRVEEPVDATYVEHDQLVNPRYEQVGHALFKNQRYKAPKVKKARVQSALPRPNRTVDRISEEEYLKTIYPNIDYSVEDFHCYRGHKKEWFGEFLQKVFEKSNQVKYDIFMQRCIKTSPYYDNGGEKFAMLKSLARERSTSAKKNYERNTIASLAKAL